MKRAEFIYCCHIDCRISSSHHSSASFDVYSLPWATRSNINVTLRVGKRRARPHFLLKRKFDEYFSFWHAPVDIPCLPPPHQKSNDDLTFCCCCFVFSLFIAQTKHLLHPPFGVGGKRKYLKERKDLDVSVIRLASSLSLSWHFTKKKMSDDEEESQELVMIAEKARSLLNRKERQVLSHCCHSYLSGRTGVHHFVDALLRLLPTPDKVNCFSSIPITSQMCICFFCIRSRPDSFFFFKSWLVIG